VAGRHRRALARPARQYGSWKTVASRFYRWRQQGVVERLLAEVHRRADACGELDWLVTTSTAASCGRTSTPPAPATSLPRRPERGITHPQDEALGRSRGGLSTKLHLRTDGRGWRLVLLVTGGQRHEVTQLERLLDGGRSSAPAQMGTRGGVGRVGGRSSWSGTQAICIGVRGGCCAVAASPR
jgi:hypothetical protein